MLSVLRHGSVSPIAGVDRQGLGDEGFHLQQTDSLGLSMPYRSRKPALRTAEVGGKRIFVRIKSIPAVEVRRRLLDSLVSADAKTVLWVRMEVANSPHRGSGRCVCTGRSFGRLLYSRGARGRCAHLRLPRERTDGPANGHANTEQSSVCLTCS